MPQFHTKLLAKGIAMRGIDLEAYTASELASLLEDVTSELASRLLITPDAGADIRMAADEVRGLEANSRALSVEMYANGIDDPVAGLVEAIRQASEARKQPKKPEVVYRDV